jgi:hypothetical protein
MKNESFRAQFASDAVLSVVLELKTTHFNVYMHIIPRGRVQIHVCMYLGTYMAYLINWSHCPSQYIQYLSDDQPPLFNANGKRSEVKRARRQVFLRT